MSKILDQKYFAHTKEQWRLMPKAIVDGAIEDILYFAKKELKVPLKEATVLDVGCGSGGYVFGIEKYVKKVVGVEPYKPGYQQALENKKRFKSQAQFVNELIENYDTNERFDLVINLSCVEHMPRVEDSFKRVLSLMNKGGIIYLTAPNKWWPIEQHYKLPFLSMLPLPLANLYVRITGKADSYEDCSYFKSYFGMRKIFDALPCTYTFTLPHDINSAYIGIGNQSFHYKLLKNFGMFLINLSPLFWVISKGFIMVIRKT